MRTLSYVLLFAFLAGIAIPVSNPVFAQDASALAQELDRLRRDIKDLQRTVFAGEDPPEGAVESIEAANASANARTQLKIQALENRIRGLTGKMEEMRFQVDSVATRLDKLISDVDYRLQALESGTVQPQQIGQNQTGQTQIGQAQVGQVNRSAVTQTDGQATTIISSSGQQVEQVQSLESGQQSLGQLSANQSGQIVASQNLNQAAIEPSAFQQNAVVEDVPTAVPVTGSVTETTGQTAALALGQLPEGSPKDQYDYAFNLLRDRNFPAAEAALKTFLDQNDDGPLAANAMYWLGESHYARQDFRSAAAVFVDAYTNFPNGSKASHSLLKLGMSLGALGKTNEACIAFQELNSKFPNAGDRVLNRAEAEAAKVGCT